jgi:hypothetical protein
MSSNPLKYRKSFGRLMAILEYYFLFEEEFAKQNVHPRDKTIEVMGRVGPKTPKQFQNGATDFGNFMHQNRKQ